MARDILGGFGPDTQKSQASPADCGGCLTPSDVMNYKPPVGPSNINDPKSPGLHGTNHGNSPGFK